MKKSKLIRRKCLHCRQFFHPDYRNARHQRYCQNAACRQASKAASQQHWLNQADNRDYFRGSQHVRRVQEWRKAHPGYWKDKKRTSAPSQSAQAQALNPGQSSGNVPTSPLRTLQDYCLAQEPEFIGLISMFTGSTLQEDIAATARQLLDRGRSILALGLSNTPGVQLYFDYDRQTSAASGSAAPNSCQL